MSFHIPASPLSAGLGAPSSSLLNSSPGFSSNPLSGFMSGATAPFNPSSLLSSASGIAGLPDIGFLASGASKGYNPTSGRPSPGYPPTQSYTGGDSPAAMMQNMMFFMFIILFKFLIDGLDDKKAPKKKPKPDHPHDKNHGDDLKGILTRLPGVERNRPGGLEALIEEGIRPIYDEPVVRPRPDKDEPKPGKDAPVPGDDGEGPAIGDLLDRATALGQE